MGTNFYLLNAEHVGKRSAAGPYCWDCGISLCKDGESSVHLSKEWYEKCPICGDRPIDEPLEVSVAGRELGFNKSKPAKKTGVCSCSSFTWAIWPGDDEDFSRRRKIKDEYGRKYTKKEFDKMLEECPIIFESMIGQEFS